MKYKLITIIILFLLSVSLINAKLDLPSNIISHNELNDLSDRELTIYLDEEVQFTNSIIDSDSGKIYYYFKTKTIEPNKDGTLSFKDLDIKTAIPLKDWENCLDSNSESECERNLIKGLSMYKTGSYNSVSGQEIMRKTIYMQRDEEIQKNIDRILEYKNSNSDILETLFEKGNKLIKKIRELNEKKSNREEEIMEEVLEPVVDQTAINTILSLISFDAITGNYRIGNNIILDAFGNVIVVNNLNVGGTITSNGTSIVPQTNITGINTNLTNSTINTGEITEYILTSETEDIIFIIE